MKKGKLTLRRIKSSHKTDKKYDAVFLTPDGDEKTVPFGQRGYNDFIIYNWIFNTLFIFIFTLIMMRLAINFKKIIINNFKTKIFYHFNIRI